VGVVIAGVTPNGSEPERSASPGRSEATVENRTGREVVAYVSAGGIEWRLGLVRSLEQRTFPLPQSVRRLEAYHLIVDATGSKHRLVSNSTPTSTSSPRFTIRGGSISSTTQWSPHRRSADTRVSQLKGGFRAWSAAGLPMATPAN
jgi:hypothetical protein